MWFTEAIVTVFAEAVPTEQPDADLGIEPVQEGELLVAIVEFDDNTVNTHSLLLSLQSILILLSLLLLIIT